MAERRIDILRDRIAELEAVIKNCCDAFDVLAKESVSRNDERHLGYVLMGDKADLPSPNPPSARND